MSITSMSSTAGFGGLLAADAGRPFRLNALYLAIAGVDLLLLAGWISEILVGGTALAGTLAFDGYIRGVGVACLGMAGFIVLGLRRGWDLGVVPMLNVVSAVCFTAFALALIPALSGTGLAMIFALALIDAEFAFFQWRALRR